MIFFVNKTVILKQVSLKHALNLQEFLERQHRLLCFYNGLVCVYTLENRGCCIRKGRHT